MSEIVNVRKLTRRPKVTFIIIRVNLLFDLAFHLDQTGPHRTVAYLLTHALASAGWGSPKSGLRSIPALGPSETGATSEPGTRASAAAASVVAYPKDYCCEAGARLELPCQSQGDRVTHVLHGLVDRLTAVVNRRLVGGFIGGGRFRRPFARITPTSPSACLD